MSDHDEVRAFITDPALQRRLAKYRVLQCFRNSMLEDLHAGTSPSSASGDYADVTVSSPYGVIPWPKVSRLNDDEMKRLMIDVVDRTYQFIHALFDENTGGKSCYAWQNVILCRIGTSQDFATTAPRSNRLSRKPNMHRKYTKANNGCRDAPFVED